MRVKSLVACVALWPLLVSAAAPVRIPPSSKWVLDYGNDSCRLIRRFGEGSTETKLVFEGVAPDEMNLLLVGGTLRPGHRESDVKARFLPGTGDPFVGMGADTEQGKGAAFWSALPLTPGWDSRASKAVGRKKHDDPSSRPTIDPVEREATRAHRIALAATTTELSVTPVTGGTMVLETGSLKRPIAMFDDCERDLLRQWGVDPDTEDKIVKPIWAPHLMSWFSSGDYPSIALARGAQSDVKVRLAVDATGRVTKYASLSVFNAPEFNKLVCDVFLAKGKFAPAELADGTKAASYFSQTVKFRIPSY